MKWWSVEFESNVLVAYDSKKKKKFWNQLTRFYRHQFDWKRWIENMLMHNVISVAKLDGIKLTMI